MTFLPMFFCEYRGMRLISVYVLFLFLVAQLCFVELVFSRLDYSTGNLSSSRRNRVSDINFPDGSIVKPTLLRETREPRYACGFFCNGECDKYFFAFFIIKANSEGPIYDTGTGKGLQQDAWSVNGEYHVNTNSTLELTSDGDLIIKDSDGATSWSTNTSGKSVMGMDMTEIGNLVLYNSRNETLWQALNCGDSQYHEFLEIKDVTYLGFISETTNTDIKTGKEACLKNCSCEAALFRNGFNETGGDCYTPSDIFSLLINRKEVRGFNATAFVRIQGHTPPTGPPFGKRDSNKGVIVGVSIGAFFGSLLLIGSVYLVYARKQEDDTDEEEYLDQVPGMPIRFSYEHLKIATNHFTQKVGEGGFGAVFQGKLGNGTHIAVKLLDGLSHIKKSFLAEVETIGGVHHMNLVTLIGFCAEKFHRGLVYEYMPNGSLEKWIFKPNAENVLDWKQRMKIILDIAKGLSYLHEDCRQKIVHLDIKPQNILLDEKFNAKVSDFGLS